MFDFTTALGYTRDEDADAFFSQSGLDQLRSNTTLSEEDTLTKGMSINLNPFQGQLASLSLAGNGSGSAEETALTGKLGIDTSADFTAQLFNAAEEKDEEGYFGGDDAAIPFQTGKAVMRYAIELMAKAEVSAGLHGVGLKLEAEGKLKTLAYLHHQATEKVRPALWQDLRRFPFVFRWQDVANLAVGDAVGFQTEAKLGLDLSFETTDVLSGGLSGLTQLLQASDTIGVEMTVGGKVDFSTAIKDTFQLFIIRESESQYRVKLKKAQNKSLTAGASLSVSAKMKDPGVVSSAIGKLLPGLVAQVVNVPGVEAVLTGLANGEDKDSLAQHYPDAIAQLADKLHVSTDNTAAALDALSGQLESLESGIKDTLETKVAAAISFEYERIKSNSELLDASVPTAVLKACHGELINLNPQSLLEAARAAGNAVQVHKYVYAESSTTKKRWGISLSIGKLDLGVSKESEVNTSLEKNFTGEEKVTWDGRKTREADGFRWVQKNYGGLDATMAGFVAGPAYQDFAYGLSLGLSMDVDSNKFKKAHSEQFLEVMDVAAAWGILKNDAWKSTSEELFEALKGEKQEGKSDSHPTFALGMKVSPEFIAGIADRWQDLVSDPAKHRHFIAQCLGRAMPYMKGFDLRADAQQKKQLYSQILLTYLPQEGWPLGHERVDKSPDPLEYIQKYASEHRNAVNQEFWTFEISNSPNEIGTLNNQLQKNENIALHWKSFHEGVGQLLAWRRSGEAYKRGAMKDLFQAFGRIYQSAWGVRALGHYFNELSSMADAETRKQLEVSFEVNYLKDGTLKTKKYLPAEA